MSTKNKPTVKEEEIRMENELIRAKIMLLTGNHFGSGMIKTDLPPRIENQFLKNVLRMEEARSKAREISIYDFIGKPEIIKEHLLDDDQLSKALTGIEKLLEENQILCDSICEVEERIFYKFITEELLNENILNVRLPGMTCCFTYEEFHPNHEYDVGKLCDDMISVFINNDFETRTYIASEESLVNYDELRLFRESFCEIRNMNYDITGFHMNDNSAEIDMELTFDGIVSRGQKPIHYDGKGKMLFALLFGHWDVTEVILPGMR